MNVFFQYTLFKKFVYNNLTSISFFSMHSHFDADEAWTFDRIKGATDVKKTVTENGR